MVMSEILVMIFNRHNQFFLPRVDKLFERLHDSIDADYYGVINADILISDSVFSILDVIDELATNGTISSIVDN